MPTAFTHSARGRYNDAKKHSGQDSKNELQKVYHCFPGILSDDNVRESGEAERTHSLFDYPAATSFSQQVVQQLPLINVFLWLSALDSLSKRLFVHQIDPLL